MASPDDPEDLSPESPSYYEDLTTLLDTLFSTPSLVTIIPDLPTLHSYTTLTSPARILYLRLYLRKRSWLRPESFSYKEVPDVVGAVGELVGASFLVRLKEDCENMTVDELLRSFSAKETKGLCKYFNLKATGTMGTMQKSVLNMCKKQKTLFGGVSGTAQRVKKKCLEMLENMIKVKEGHATILDKVLIASFPQYLFSYEEDDKVSFTGKGNLSRILLSNFELASKFPSYTISYTKPIFSSSHQLETFLAACQLEAQCHALLDKSNWGEIKQIYLDNKYRYETVVETWDETRELPQNSHLLHFTEDWVLTRVMRQCLGALQRLKEYPAAVALLRLLLKYRPMRHRRGSWWETLALILDHHLKEHKAAREAAYAGLADPDTTHGHRIALEARLCKLDPEFGPSFTFEPTKVTLDIVALEGSGSAANSRKIYVGRSENGGTVLCGVEDVILNYYINNNNLKEGLHCEGAIVSTLFAILCWDLIFCDTVENVFYNPYQYHPLDFWSPEFYINRKVQFEEHFTKLRGLSDAQMNVLIAQTWENHFGTGCVGLNWDLFADAQQCQRCIVCITPSKLVQLFEVYVEDTRLKRSGLPDLSIWNFDSMEFIMVEVKGPGDSLRNNQRVWLSTLDNIGIKGVVCHVQAVSSKKLR